MIFNQKILWVSAIYQNIYDTTNTKETGLQLQKMAS